MLEQPDRHATAQVWNELVARARRATSRKLKDKLQLERPRHPRSASIVEKEAVDPAERPRIAQVFINRLTSPSFKPKRLETDPTIRYGCLVPLQKSAACVAWNEPCRAQGKPPGCDRLHRAQLDDKDNPYNTYQHEGLPPGPIAIPGKRVDRSDDVARRLRLLLLRRAQGIADARVREDAAEHERNVEKYVEARVTDAAAARSRTAASPPLGRRDTVEP